MPDLLFVTYKEKDSLDQYGKKICSVNHTSVQCNAGYTPRVRLCDAKLILENVKPSDSGVYTIWSKKYPEILVSYIVSVKGTFSVQKCSTSDSVTVRLQIPWCDSAGLPGILTHVHFIQVICSLLAFALLQVKDPVCTSESNIIFVLLFDLIIVNRSSRSSTHPCKIPSVGYSPLHKRGCSFFQLDP